MRAPERWFTMAQEAGPGLGGWPRKVTEGEEAHLTPANQRCPQETKAREHIMNLPLETIAVPLWEDEHGGWRVGRSRVQLERVIAAHRQGAAPADIVDMYPTLELADV